MGLWPTSINGFTAFRQPLTSTIATRATIAIIVTPVTVKKYDSVSGTFLMPPSKGSNSSPSSSQSAAHENSRRSSSSVEDVGRQVRNAPTAQSTMASCVVVCTQRLYRPMTTRGANAKLSADSRTIRDSGHAAADAGAEAGERIQRRRISPAIVPGMTTAMSVSWLGWNSHGAGELHQN